MFNKPKFRLHTLVQNAVNNLGNRNRLFHEIEEANTRVGSGCTIARGALNKLNNGEPVGLTEDNMVALHVYFSTKDSSLQHLPIFETRGVLEALSEADRLVFMYGAKGRRQEQRTDLSWWDHNSFSALQSEIALIGRRSPFENIPVLWRTPQQMNTFRTEDWYKVIDEDRASVVSIGSPLAALSSEIMLSRMFNVEPFETPHFTTTAPLPFYFAWRPQLAQNFRSAFGLTSSELALEFEDLAERNESGDSSAVIIDGEVFESPAKEDHWDIYGIIAAQRRAQGNVWMVVSGLAGPATYGTATMVKHIAEELPFSQGTPSKVIWVPVKVTVTIGEERPNDGDLRKIVGCEIDGEPRIWPAG